MAKIRVIGTITASFSMTVDARDHDDAHTVAEEDINIDDLDDLKPESIDITFTEDVNDD